MEVFRIRLRSMVKICGDRHKAEKENKMAEQRRTPANMTGIYRKSLAPGFSEDRGLGLI